MGDLRKNIEKEPKKTRRTATAQPPASAAGDNVHINVMVNDQILDDQMLERIKAEQKKDVMELVPDMFSMADEFMYDKANKANQAKMGDRLFADHVFRCKMMPASRFNAGRMSQVNVSLLETNQQVLLHFDDGEMLMIDFDKPLPSENDIRFDEAVGIHTQHARFVKPADRACDMAKRLTIWNHRHAIDTCTVGGDEKHANRCVVHVTFTDSIPPQTLTYCGGNTDSEFETYENAAKAAYDNWATFLGWKENAAREADKVIEFAAFRKRNCVFLSTCNTRCVFSFSYYGADWSASKLAYKEAKK